MALDNAGGSVDTLISWRGASLGQERFRELVENVTLRVGRLEETSLSEEFLRSEEFVELFQSVAEAAIRSSSKAKREHLSGLLAGSVRRSAVTELSVQIARDLAALDELHLRILESLPRTGTQHVYRDLVPQELAGMPPHVHAKGMADLERLGFLRFNNEGIGAYGGGEGYWETTDYITYFWNEIADGG